eukprot:296420_1
MFSKPKTKLDNSTNLNAQSNVRCIFTNKPCCRQPMRHSSLKTHYLKIHGIDWNAKQVQFYLTDDLSQVYAGPASKRRKLTSGEAYHISNQIRGRKSINYFPPEIHHIPTLVSISPSQNIGLFKDKDVRTKKVSKSKATTLKDIGAVSNDNILFGIPTISCKRSNIQSKKSKKRKGNINDENMDPRGSKKDANAKSVNIIIAAIRQCIFPQMKQILNNFKNELKQWIFEVLQ